MKSVSTYLLLFVIVRKTARSHACCRSYSMRSLCYHEWLKYNRGFRTAKHQPIRTWQFKFYTIQPKGGHYVFMSITQACQLIRMAQLKFCTRPPKGGHYVFMSVNQVLLLIGKSQLKFCTIPRKGGRYVLMSIAESLQPIMNLTINILYHTTKEWPRYIYIYYYKKNTTLMTKLATPLFLYSVLHWLSQVSPVLPLKQFQRKRSISQPMFYVCWLIDWSFSILCLLVDWLILFVGTVSKASLGKLLR